MKYRAIIDRVNYDPMGAEPVVMDSYDARLLEELVKIILNSGKYVAKVFNVVEPQRRKKS